MEKKTKQKPKASKPEVVKLPETIYIIRDLFLEFEGFEDNQRTVGFSYSKEEAEKLAAKRFEEQEQILARYALLSSRERIELDSEKLSKIQEEMAKIDSIAGYIATDTFELKLLKK